MKAPLVVTSTAPLVVAISLIALGLDQLAFAEPPPLYDAINNMAPPAGSTIRKAAVAPAAPGGQPAQLDSPDYDTNAWFQALPDDGSFGVPDTHGAVGPNHVMTMLNTQVRIQNRTGTTNYVTMPRSVRCSGGNSSPVFRFCSTDSSVVHLRTSIRFPALV